jgi:PAS domain S-box-containing protein
MMRTQIEASAANRRISRLTLLASIIDSVDDAIISRTLDGHITSWNPAAERMYGYTAEEAVGRLISIVTPPGKEEDTTALLNGVADGLPAVHYETVRLRKNGDLVPVSITVSPVRDDDNRVVGASSIARDITDRLEAERRVRAASEYARSLIEASLDPLVTISPDGKITDLNEATARVTGRSREALIGTDFADYFTEPDTARESYRQVFAEGSVTDYSLTICHLNGKQVEVLYNASLYKDPEGNVLGVVAAARDVTAQRRAETELAAQRETEMKRLVELERFQELTVGRELKMIELKEVIAELEEERAELTARLDTMEAGA